MGLWTLLGKHHTGSKVKLLAGVQGISAMEQRVLRMLGKGTKMGVGWGEGRALAPMDDKRQVPHPIWEEARLLGLSMPVDRASPPFSWHYLYPLSLESESFLFSCLCPSVFCADAL